MMANDKTKKSDHRKVNRKVVIFAILALANTMAVSAVSLAWFITNTSNAVIKTVSGDLNVVIEKVTAYKYVYPFYSNSTEFINYEVKGPDANYIKSYTIEDSSITGGGNALITDIAVTKDESSENRIALAPSDASATTIYYENSQGFRYYLVGNNVFTGVTENPWSTLSAFGFAEKRDLSASTNAILRNVVFSVGAEFTVIDASTISNVPESNPAEKTCAYYSYSSVSGYSDEERTHSEDSPFSVLEGGKTIKCLKSGIYDIFLSNSKLSIVKSASRSSDDAIIGNNLIDPTKITIDHAGGKYPGKSLSQCLPSAIQDQNTMVILDVELRYRNVDRVRAGLRVYRQKPPLGEALSQEPAHIYNLSGRYNNEDKHTTGYVSSTTRNQLYASDFYAFYGQFTSDEDKYSSPAAAWQAMHQLTNADDGEETPRLLFTKFSNSGTEYDDTINDYDLFAKTGSASDLIIPASANGDHLSGKYHCYIGVDYDYEHIEFFMKPIRLGKTYVLDRDFGFYFTATQVLENTVEGD